MSSTETPNGTAGTGAPAVAAATLADGGPPKDDGPAQYNVWQARLRDLTLLPALIVLFIVGALANDTFLTSDNLTTIAGAGSALALVVLAEALILLTGKFDLSLESTVGLAPAIGFMLVIPAASQGFGTDLPTWVGLLAIFAVGALVGVANGFLIVRLGLNAFVVTLAMLIVLRGIQTGTTEGKTLFNAPEAFFTLGSEKLLGFPLSAWLAGLAYLLAWGFLRYYRTGRAIYAVGGNPDAARAAGINVERVTFGVFVVGGILASLAGLVLAGRVGAIDANLGDGMIFTVFAAAVIGGISLDGGRGSVVGALLGVILLATVQNLLTLLQVQPYWINAIYGGIILGALVISRVTGGANQN